LPGSFKCSLLAWWFILCQRWHVKPFKVVSLPPRPRKQRGVRSDKARDSRWLVTYLCRALWRLSREKRSDSWIPTLGLREIRWQPRISGGIYSINQSVFWFSLTTIDLRVFCAISRLYTLGKTLVQNGWVKVSVCGQARWQLKRTNWSEL